MQIYADEEEKESMAICGPPSVTLQGNELLKLKNLGRGRALDVACGDGRVTRELLA